MVFLAAPALSELGIPELVSHFIIFYFGALAMITPPIAPAVLVASGIAKTNFMKTAVESIKLGMPIFLLPFAFVNYPELLVISSKTIVSIMFVAMGLLFFSYGIYSSDRGIYSYLFRMVCLAESAAILIIPVNNLPIYGALAILAVFSFYHLLQKFRNRENKSGLI